MKLFPNDIRPRPWWCENFSEARKSKHLQQFEHISPAVLSDRTFEGEAIFHQSIQIGVKDPAPDGSREMEWSWGAFNRDAGSKTTLPAGAGTHSINFPATTGLVSSGKLVFDVSPW